VISFSLIKRRREVLFEKADQDEKECVLPLYFL